MAQLDTLRMHDPETKKIIQSSVQADMGDPGFVSLIAGGPRGPVLRMYSTEYGTVDMPLAPEDVTRIALWSADVFGIYPMMKATGE